MSVDIAVIGAQKCGLCSTRKWLSGHPDLEVYHWEWAGWAWSPEKRAAWCWPSWRLPSDPDPSALAAMGAWTPFTEPRQGKPRVLVSPQMSMYDTQINARLMRTVNPGMKIVMLTRDPVERAYISWWQAHRQKERPKVHDERPFEEAIEDCLAWRPVQDLCQPLQDQYVTAGEYDRIADDFRDAGFDVLTVPLRALAANDRACRNQLEHFIEVDLGVLGAFPHVHSEGPDLPVPDSGPVRWLRYHYGDELWRKWL